MAEVHKDEKQPRSEDRGGSLMEPGPTQTQQTPVSCVLCGNVLKAPGCGRWLCGQLCGKCLDQEGTHSCVTDSERRQNLITNLKKMKTKSSAGGRSIAVLRCLTELRDHSVHQQILDFLQSYERTYERSDDYSARLSGEDCSALADLLRRSPEVLEELSPLKYRTANTGHRNLVPAVSNCRQANFDRLDMSESDLEMVASALMSSPSHLALLDLSGNPVVSSEMQKLCEGLQSPNCRLETLRLSCCGLTESSCSALASALKANPSHLRVLELNRNSGVRDAGLQHLCGFLQSPDCRLESLRLWECELTEVGCSSLVSVLKSNPSHLKVLDFQDNTELRDAGVEHLCGFLKRPDCRLEMLGLYNCEITWSGCRSLTSALVDNPSHLRELELGLNPELKDLGVDALCGFLQSPDCRLEVLGLGDCGVSRSSCSSLASALKANPSHLRELTLTGFGLRRKTDLRELLQLQQSPDCRLEALHPWTESSGDEL